MKKSGPWIMSAIHTNSIFPKQANIWTVFWATVWRLVKVEGKMDAKQCCEILEDSLMESFKTLGIEEGEYYVQQDNDPKHTSKKAKKSSENNGIQVIF